MRKLLLLLLLLASPVFAQTTPVFDQTVTKTVTGLGGDQTEPFPGAIPLAGDYVCSGEIISEVGMRSVPVMVPYTASTDNAQIVFRWTWPTTYDDGTTFGVGEVRTARFTCDPAGSPPIDPTPNPMINLTVTEQ